MRSSLMCEQRLTKDKGAQIWGQSKGASTEDEESAIHFCCIDIDSAD